MKNLCKLSLAIAIAAAAFSTNSHAQTVVLNGLGSSAMFLELGWAATDIAHGSINAACLWDENTNTVSASDPSTPFSASSPAVDKGSAWVAWTTGTGGTCANPTSDAKIYAYLQTDSVVGNRCVFDGNCTMNYSSAPSTPAGAIPGRTEVSLPSTFAALLNTKPNFAGTDIRPEDAAFATLRATTACGTAVVTGSQYLGLGYSAINPTGALINGSSQGLGSSFNVINFTLPASFDVQTIGVTPILVVAASSDTTGNAITQFSNLTTATLAKLLDGTYSTANAAGGTGTDNIYVFEREPLSGTYNTMEYNVPNTTVNKTSQDVGSNQLASQVNCPGNASFLAGSNSNPMAIFSNTSGSGRFRAIGTGNELKAARTYSDASNLTNSLAYGFWSVGNFAGYGGALTNNGGQTVTVKYLEVNGSDPLGAGGVIPTTSAQLNNINFTAVTSSTGNYPIWSFLRLVTPSSDSGVQTAVLNLASTAGAETQLNNRPDFIASSSMSVVRSHFAPPGVTVGGAAITANNGKLWNTGGSCGTEAGGDVGGVPEPTSSTSLRCSTGHRE